MDPNYRRARAAVRRRRILGSPPRPLVNERVLALRRETPPSTGPGPPSAIQFKLSLNTSLQLTCVNAGLVGVGAPSRSPGG
jgi:hypothetical protein